MLGTIEHKCEVFFLVEEKNDKNVVLSHLSDLLLPFERWRKKI